MGLAETRRYLKRYAECPMTFRTHIEKGTAMHEQMMANHEALKKMLRFINSHNGCQGVEIAEQDDKLILFCAACYSRQEEAQMPLDHSISFDVSAEWQSLLAESRGITTS